MDKMIKEIESELVDDWELWYIIEHMLKYPLAMVFNLDYDWNNDNSMEIQRYNG